VRCICASTPLVGRVALGGPLSLPQNSPERPVAPVERLHLAVAALSLPQHDVLGRLARLALQRTRELRPRRRGAELYKFTTALKRRRHPYTKEGWVCAMTIDVRFSPLP
jgi:hypothetical protein